MSKQIIGRFVVKTRGKIRAKCIEAIENNPGILRPELYTMNIGHRSNIGIHISKLVYERIVVRVWDDAMGTWRLYPKGKLPPHTRHDVVYRKSLASQHKSPISKDLHGEKFRMAFDEYYKILYMDLRMLWVGIQEMLARQSPPGACPARDMGNRLTRRLR